MFISLRKPYFDFVPLNVLAVGVSLTSSFVLTQLYKRSIEQQALTEFKVKWKTFNLFDNFNLDIADSNHYLSPF